MHYTKKFGIITFGLIISVTSALAQAQSFKLTSSDFRQGGKLKESQVYNTFGCQGGNQSPALSWSNVPKNTQSLVLTAYDPNAPTGSGWWHWIVYDMPADTRSLATNAGTVNSTTLPAGAKQGRNDAGTYDFGGACPPKGDKPHRYIFTLYALDIPHLDVPPDASAAHIGFAIHNHIIAKTTTYAKYGR